MTNHADADCPIRPATKGKVGRSDLSEYWTIGPAAPSLGASAFSPREAQRLVLLKVRYERGAFREVAAEQKRLFFVRWLFRRGRRSDLIVSPRKGGEERSTD